MIHDKDTNIIYFSDILLRDTRYLDDFKRIINILDSLNLVYRFLPFTKDIWVRDFMPIQVSTNKFIEYRYDPDYLQGIKNDRRSLKSYPDIVCDALNLKTIKTDLVLDGGNVIKSTNCIILTDKVIEENKSNYSKKELLEKMRQLFEVDKVILIPWDKSEEFGHADGMIRFIDDYTVLLNGYFQTYPRRFKEQLYGELEQNGINWKELIFQVDHEDDNNWAYINYLQTNDLILVPELDIDEDEQAFKQIGDCFPEYIKQNRIKRVNINKILKEGGALNCISWTIFEGRSTS